MHRDFLNLYDSCYDDVYRYVYFKVGNKWDTEDVVSETFKKAYEKYRTINKNPRSWLFSIAKNTVTDFYRKKRDITLSNEDMEACTYLNTGCNLPEDELGLIELKQVLYTLPEDDFEIVNLRCFADMTFKDIGKYLNKSEAAVKVRYSRIIKRLQEMLDEKTEVDL